MATDKDHDLLNEFLEQRRHEESLHSHGKGRRAQHRSGGGDVMYHPDDWQPLWLLGRARDAKGFEDGSTAQRFRPSRLYSVDYAFGYLVGYAWKTGQRVDWGAVMRSCNRLDRAKAGDFSMLNWSLLKGYELSQAERKVIAEVLVGYRKRPPHAVKTLPLLVRNVILGDHVVRTAVLEGRRIGRKLDDPEHLPNGLIKFAVSDASKTFKVSERTVRNAHREYLDNEDFDRHPWLI